MDVFGRRKTPFYKWLIWILLPVFVGLGLLFFSVDQLCHQAIEQWTPFYPGAVVVDSHHNYIRPRALGYSTVILESDEDTETIKQFYRDLTINLMQAEESHGLASTQWRVEPQADGDGNLIYLYSACGT